MRIFSIKLSIRKDHENRKIHSIKALREITGWGLKQSKDLIDRMYYDPDNSWMYTVDVHVFCQLIETMSTGATDLQLSLNEI